MLSSLRNLIDSLFASLSSSVMPSELSSPSNGASICISRRFGKGEERRQTTSRIPSMAASRYAQFGGLMMCKISSEEVVLCIVVAPCPQIPWGCKKLRDNMG